MVFKAVSKLLKLLLTVFETS